jgi:hypothetical protein
MNSLSIMAASFALYKASFIYFIPAAFKDQLARVMVIISCFMQQP